MRGPIAQWEKQAKCPVSHSDISGALLDKFHAALLFEKLSRMDIVIASGPDSFPVDLMHDCDKQKNVSKFA